MALPLVFLGKRGDEMLQVGRQQVVTVTLALWQRWIDRLTFVCDKLARLFADHGSESGRPIEGQIRFAEQRVWHTGLTKSEAEQVSDWLEAHGHHDCELSTSSDGFTVTAWRSPADRETTWTSRPFGRFSTVLVQDAIRRTHTA